ncbi:hypothetical protein [Bradyrhizobium sp. STM 3561]|uniref:hypothetical protein n=1 Tax=Bradyrhizobium sp. STM 3561 TaxID=578923 RepID=UPI00388E96A0
MTATQKLPRRSRTKKTAEVDVTKITKLIRLLASDRDGEVLATVSALKRALAAVGKDLHDLANATETGFKPPAPPPHRQVTWGPPPPRPDNWQSMAWFAFHRRFDLCTEDRGFIEDCLLGTTFRETDDQVMTWHLERLRRIVAIIQAR